MKSSRVSCLLDPRERKKHICSFWPLSGGPTILLSLLILICCITMNTLYLKFSKLNVNSLNSSICTGDAQLTKVTAILNLKSDVIFLSDLRLSNRAKMSCAKSVADKFNKNQIESYDFFFCSTQNKRGTGILIKKSINILVDQRREDQEENYLLLSISYKGKKLIIGSIYGPNDYNPDFFERLKDDILALGNHSIVLSGDWNCTVSCNPVNTNNDCLYMRSPPNLRHSQILNDICEELDITDPFLVTYPNRKEFTYIPRNAQQKNRSRIDFFLVSRVLLERNFEIKIGESLLHSSFDHKHVSLNFKTVSGSSSLPKIFNSTIDGPETEICVWTAVVEMHLIHADVGLLRGGGPI
jgi:exonuclease III